MSKADRIAELQTRLTKVQAAINATLDRGVASYSTEIQSVGSMRLSDLREQEKSILNELARLRRGTRFGKAGFVAPT